MKKLRAFIQENKTLFDDQELPVGLWEEIEERLESKVSKSSPKILWIKTVSIAACILLLVSVGIGIYQLGQHHGREAYAHLNPELVAQWEKYEIQVNTKKDSLQSVLASLPQEVQIEVPFQSELEEQYQALQKELKTSPNQTTTLQALIDLLQLQLHYYSYQLELIQQQKTTPNDEHTS